ncbi:uncharacterized protein DDB_G0283357-like [Mya arenaria]|uniref:uncharacterized protein DDB_G0283357-like n=1 Tax=Mya arenaria TaxID=6604 RepID=UPI0022E2CB0B|nr:uncharacterized protein DDB_G0283357-like [Mya arenaria]
MEGDSPLININSVDNGVTMKTTGLNDVVKHEPMDESNKLTDTKDANKAEKGSEDAQEKSTTNCEVILNSVVASCDQVKNNSLTDADDSEPANNDDQDNNVSVENNELVELVTVKIEVEEEEIKDDTTGNENVHTLSAESTTAIDVNDSEAINEGGNDDKNNSKMVNMDACSTSKTADEKLPDSEAHKTDDCVLMEYRKVGDVIVVDSASDSSPDSSSDEEEAVIVEDQQSTDAQINSVMSGNWDRSPEGNEGRKVKMNRYGFEDLRTKGELLPEELPPLEELTITVDESVKMEEVGVIQSVVGILVVIQSKENVRPLDDDSILFVEGHKVLGQVFEVFGPVKTPWYSVRFNDPDNIGSKGLEVGMKVFCAPSEAAFTRYVFLEDLKNLKGSDASWEDNNEPPEKHLAYSDDEAERAAKARRKGKKGGAKQGEGETGHGEGRKRNRSGHMIDGGRQQGNNSQQHNQDRNPFQGSNNNNSSNNMSSGPRFSHRPQGQMNNSGGQRWQPGAPSNFNRPPSNFGGPPRFHGQGSAGFNDGSRNPNTGNFPQTNPNQPMPNNANEVFGNFTPQQHGQSNTNVFQPNVPPQNYMQNRPMRQPGTGFSSPPPSNPNAPPDFTRPPPLFQGMGPGSSTQTGNQSAFQGNVNQSGNFGGVVNGGQNPGAPFANVRPDGQRFGQPIVNNQASPASGAFNQMNGFNSAGHGGNVNPVGNNSSNPRNMNGQQQFAVHALNPVVSRQGSTTGSQAVNNQGNGMPTEVNSQRNRFWNINQGNMPNNGISPLMSPQNNMVSSNVNGTNQPAFNQMTQQPMGQAPFSTANGQGSMQSSFVIPNNAGFGQGMRQPMGNFPIQNMGNFPNGNPNTAVFGGHSSGSFQAMGSGMGQAPMGNGVNSVETRNGFNANSHRTNDQNTLMDQRYIQNPGNN